MAKRGADRSRFMKRMGDVLVEETKTGHEYRVRKDGKIMDEVETRSKAMDKAHKLVSNKKNRVNRSK